MKTLLPLVAMFGLAFAGTDAKEAAAAKPADVKSGAKEAAAAKPADVKSDPKDAAAKPAEAKAAAPKHDAEEDEDSDGPVCAKKGAEMKPADEVKKTN